MIRVVFRGDFEADAENWHRVRRHTPDISTVPDGAHVDGPDPVVVVTGLPHVRPAVCSLHAGGLSGGVIVVGFESTAQDVWSAFELGASGFVQTESPAEELITAIRAVAAGHRFFPPVFLPELAERVAMTLARERLVTRDLGLTGRELDVLSMLAEGSRNADIAKRLFISESTVRTHVLSILRKFGARNRTEAVVMATRKGIVGDG